MTALNHGWPVWSRSSKVIMGSHHPHTAPLPSSMVHPASFNRSLRVYWTIWKTESVTESAGGFGGLVLLIPGLEVGRVPGLWGPPAV